MAKVLHKATAGGKIEMPRYRFKKEDVWALKIADVAQTAREARLVPEDNRFAPLFMSGVWGKANKPKKGDYFVQRADGEATMVAAAEFLRNYRKPQGA